MARTRTPPTPEPPDRSKHPTPDAGAPAQPGARRRSGGVRPTKAIHEQRLASIFPLVVLGMTRGQIIRAVTKAVHEEATKRAEFAARRAEGDVTAIEPVRLWGDVAPSLRTVDHYMARCVKRLRKLSDFDRAKELGGALARYRLLFRKAVEAGQLSTAYKIQARVDKLLGLEAPTRHDIRTPDVPPGAVQAVPAKLPEEARRLAFARLLGVARARMLEAGSDAQVAGQAGQGGGQGVDGIEVHDVGASTSDAHEGNGSTNGSTNGHHEATLDDVAPFDFKAGDAGDEN